MPKCWTIMKKTWTWTCTGLFRIGSDTPDLDIVGLSLGCVDWFVRGGHRHWLSHSDASFLVGSFHSSILGVPIGSVSEGVITMNQVWVQWPKSCSFRFGLTVIWVCSGGAQLAFGWVSHTAWGYHSMNFLPVVCQYPQANGTHQIEHVFSERC